MSYGNDTCIHMSIHLLMKISFHLVNTNRQRLYYLIISHILDLSIIIYTIHLKFENKKKTVGQFTNQLKEEILMKISFHPVKTNR